MKKQSSNTWLWLIGIIIVLSNPALLWLGIIGLFVYLAYKDKNKLKKGVETIKEKYKNSDKTDNYEVIDTTATVIDSKVIQDEWKATKEYRH